MLLGDHYEDLVVEYDEFAALLAEADLGRDPDDSDAFDACSADQRSLRKMMCCFVVYLRCL